MYNCVPYIWLGKDLRNITGSFALQQISLFFSKCSAFFHSLIMISIFCHCLHPWGFIFSSTEYFLPDEPHCEWQHNGGSKRNNGSFYTLHIGSSLQYFRIKWSQWWKQHRRGHNHHQLCTCESTVFPGTVIAHNLKYVNQHNRKKICVPELLCPHLQQFHLELWWRGCKQEKQLDLHIFVW